MKQISYVILLLFVMACAPSVPSGILQKDEMEDVLYDMHIAQSIYETREGGVATGADLLALRASVLRKHDVDKAVWDSSFNYYCRNSRDMYDIYQSLAKRIERNVIALGGKVDGFQGSEADTANVWKAEDAFILMQQAPYNLFTFDVIPDSTFEDGDRITLQYDAQFIFQDGMRDIATFLAVYYDNDSIATVTSHSNFDGHGIVTLNNDVNRLHVKRIKGYFLLVQNLTQNSSNANTTTMRLAAIRNVKLLHLRTEPPAVKKEEPVEKVDSLKADSLMKDSIMKSHITVKN
ncbi:MAG: DUF4296 domain-containing protein [Prevotellaceae bacterium]|nr:DUF4296 domain-containing protein [Prevotellaceae bacterium]MDY2749402.1 DUF4296 domain-containing protein [Prevotella sp.]